MLEDTSEGNSSEIVLFPSQGRSNYRPLYKDLTTHKPGNFISSSSTCPGRKSEFAPLRGICWANGVNIGHEE